MGLKNKTNILKNNNSARLQMVYSVMYQYTKFTTFKILYGFVVHIFAFKLSFLFASLMVSSLLRCVLNFRSKIFTRYLGNWSNTWYNSSQKLSFGASLLPSVTAGTFRTIISHQQPLSALYDILLLRAFTVLTATLHTWRLSPPLTTWGCACNVKGDLFITDCLHLEYVI